MRKHKKKNNKINLTEAVAKTMLVLAILFKVDLTHVQSVKLG